MHQKSIHFLHADLFQTDSHTNMSKMTTMMSQAMMRYFPPSNCCKSDIIVALNNGISPI